MVGLLGFSGDILHIEATRIGMVISMGDGVFLSLFMSVLFLSFCFLPVL